MKNLVSIMFSDNACILVVTKIGGGDVMFTFQMVTLEIMNKEYRQINFKLEGD